MLFFDQLQKNDLQLRILGWSVLGGLAVLLASLYYVQILGSRQYSENQISQSFRTVRIPSVRGKIFDRNGTVLAENRPSYTLGLYLEELRPYFKQAWRESRPRTRLSSAELRQWEAFTRYRVATNITLRLSQVLKIPIPLDYAAFNQHYASQLALPLPLLQNLTPNQIAQLQEQPLNLPGVDVVPHPYRHYPSGSTAAHLLGHLTRDDSSSTDEDAFFNFRLPDYRGKVGVEKTFDAVLRGRAGVRSVLVNSMGYRQSETVLTPTAGNNLALTIDLAIQQACEKALAKSGIPNPRGAAVVMDPNSGDIIAMASYPTFDPNQFIPRISRADFEKLLDPKQRPQINRAVQENYAPGSIFKALVGLACLEQGLDPSHSFYNPGYIRLGRRYINDLAREGYYDFRRAFLKSSNFYFITNGLQAGVESIIALGHQLHLGEATGLPTGQEVDGDFPSLKRIQSNWSIGDTANLCIGQGMIAVTPLQMTVMTAAIANGGKVLQPRLVDRIEPASRYSEDAVETFPTAQIRDQLKVSQRSLQIVRDAMLADVEDPEGTGRAAGLPGLRVCGKTGTAEVTNTRSQVIDQITWFISYAPYDAPRYVVVVMIESGLSGGGTCAPIARAIYQALLDRESLGPTQTPVTAASNL